ncbi:MAG: methyl-accepting chemotaxis protein [Thermodesulfovibrionales bacterium]|nr:methyl-accepting chemotaxis protein [Thermodesulfovibrionales bacterium]
MNIKIRLIINVAIVFVSMVIIVFSALYGIQSIKKNITDLTQRTTPYQIKAINQQRALQAHAANLISISSLTAKEEYNRLKESVTASLEHVKRASEELAKLKGEGSSDDREISDITKQVLINVEQKLSAEEATSSAVKAIKGKLVEASKKMKDLDNSIRRLQQNTSAAMIAGVDTVMGANQQVNSLIIVRDGLKDLNIYVSKIPTTLDKRPVAVLRDNVSSATKNILAALKNIKGIDKTVQEFTQRINSINENVTGAKGLAALQLQYISEENDALKENIEALARQVGYDIAYMMPTIEREINSANNILKANTATMSKNINSFTDTNNILAAASSLALLNATIESHINHSISLKRSDEFNSASATVMGLFSQANDISKKLKDLLTKSGYTEEQKLLSSSMSALSAVQQEYLSAASKIRDALKSFEELESLNSKMKEIVAKQLEESNRAVSMAGINQEAAIISVNKVAGNTIYMVVIVGIISVVVATTIGGWIGRSIAKPIKITANMITDISKGDLTKRLDIQSKDEIGVLCRSFNDLVIKLHNSISQVANKADIVVSSATELSATAEELSNHSKIQSNEAVSLSTAAEEMSATALSVAKDAQTSATFAEETKREAMEGEKVIKEAIDGIKAIKNSITEISSSINGLIKSSQKIGEVTAVIKDIADQTNLLALNAAIEAAQAGEKGRGFAVVADSVRQLAEKTTLATSEIAEIIKSLQNSVSKSSQAMREGIEDVNRVVQRANKAEESLRVIVARIEKKTELIQQMATASNEQSTTVDSMVSNINSVARAAKEFSERTAQIAKTAEDLDRVAAELQAIVRQFRI